MTTASVVVTNHDYARYLGAAVDSALAQTWPATEVVVVDDGSTDGSLALLEQYGDRIELVAQPQRGQTAAMNAGLARSTGDVVLFLDADDVLEPCAVAAVVERMRGTRLTKVHWPVEVVDADGRATGQRLPEQALPDGSHAVAATACGPQSFPFPPTSGNAWSRAFLEQVFPLPELEAELGVGSASADALLSMLALVTGEVGALAEPLTRYRVHAGNDYAGRPLREQVDRHVTVTDRHFEVVAATCRARGWEVDVAAWQRTSWFHRLAAARRRVQALLPPGAVALLLDGGEWPPGLVPDRDLRPFPGRGGTWWGFPADDADAVAQLRRALVPEVRHVVRAWPCSWWPEAYPAMTAELHRRTWRVHADPDVTVFDLLSGDAR